jgi:molybdopterin synthase catalytic subunit/molybdopterin synthase sulfur carrier subunit
MARLRLFASIREAAGTGSTTFGGATVGEVLDAAVDAYGGPDGTFAGLLTTCNVWCNGEPAERDHRVTDADEVAVLPPVSGG